MGYLGQPWPGPAPMGQPWPIWANTGPSPDVRRPISEPLLSQPIWALAHMGPYGPWAHMANMGPYGPIQASTGPVQAQPRRWERAF